MSSDGPRTPSDDFDEIDAYYSSLVDQNALNIEPYEDKTPSPIKNPVDKIMSPNKLSKELRVIAELFTKKPPPVPVKIQTTVIHEPMKARKMKLDFRDDFKCVICKKDNHDTADCWFRCTKPTCALLDHDRNKCPYYGTYKKEPITHGVDSYVPDYNRSPLHREPDHYGYIRNLIEIPPSPQRLPYQTTIDNQVYYRQSSYYGYR